MQTGPAKITIKEGRMRKKAEMKAYAKDWVSTSEMHEIEQLHPEEVFEFSEFEDESYELKKKAVVEAMEELGYEFLGVADILNTLGYEVNTYGEYVRSLVFSKNEA